MPDGGDNDFFDEIQKVTAAAVTRKREEKIMQFVPTANEFMKQIIRNAALEGVRHVAALMPIPDGLNVLDADVFMKHVCEGFTKFTIEFEISDNKIHVAILW